MASLAPTDCELAGQLVVGADGSPESDAAARWAVADATRRHLDVVLAHAYATPDRRWHADDRMIAQLRVEHEQRIEQMASRLRVPPAMLVHQHVEPTDVVTLLLRLSEVAAAVVIGQHRPASSTVPDGRTHAKVVDAATAPVISVPPDWYAGPDRRPVIVALDGDQVSTATLAYAFDQAASHQVALVAVHAVPLSEIEANDERESPGGRLRNLTEILAGWKSEHPDQEVRTTLLAGSPRDVLALVCGSTQLLVVGSSHRTSRLTRWSRSVARAVLRQARCPVAVVPRTPVGRRRDLVDGTRAARPVR